MTKALFFSLSVVSLPGFCKEISFNWERHKACHLYFTPHTIKETILSEVELRFSDPKIKNIPRFRDRESNLYSIVPGDFMGDEDLLQIIKAQVEIYDQRKRIAILERDVIELVPYMEPKGTIIRDTKSLKYFSTKTAFIKLQGDRYLRAISDLDLIHGHRDLSFFRDVEIAGEVLFLTEDGLKVVLTPESGNYRSDFQDLPIALKAILDAGIIPDKIEFRNWDQEESEDSLVSINVEKLLRLRSLRLRRAG